MNDVGLSRPVPGTTPNFLGRTAGCIGQGTRVARSGQLGADGAGNEDAEDGGKGTASRATTNSRLRAHHSIPENQHDDVPSRAERDNQSHSQ